MLLRLLEGPTPGRGTVALPKRHSEVTSARRRPLLCAACGRRVTWEEQRREVSGRHAHTRVNPAGIEFHFGCFAEAEGCVVHGPPTDEDTWFPGCAWQFANCGGCATHLGWFFSGADAFFGLVLERLAPGDATREA